MRSKSFSGQAFVPGSPKKTRQGQGTHSKPKGTRKKMRGQGK